MSSYLDEPPSTRPSTLMGCMHGWLLSNVLSFLDLDTLASCAVSCQDWYSAVHQDDTLWRLVAHHVWPKELLRVGSPGQREPAGDQGRHDLEEAYVTFRELVLDRNSRFSVPSIPVGLQLRHARRSVASPCSRSYTCHLMELIWNKPHDEICLLFEVDGDPGKVRMPVTTFLFRRILDDYGNKYDDINVSPPCATEYTGAKGHYRGMVVWKAEDIFEANTALADRCENSHLIAKVPAERVSGIRLSLCFGLPCQGPVAVVGAMMDQDRTCGPLDKVLSAGSRRALDDLFKTRFHDGVTFKGKGASFY